MALSNSGIVEIAACGDIATPPTPPGRNFEFVMEALRSADIRFGQIERLYSERGSFQEQGLAPHVRQHPQMAETFKQVPFDILSIGSNHTGDWGPEAVEDTIETFEKLGIPTVGAGRNIMEARQEKIIEVNGLKIAFLGYVSVLLPQYWATDTRAGATPLRAHTYYEPYEYQPGAPARIVTVPYEKDMQALQEDVRRAKSKADHVVVSMHWGVHYIPKPLADYQTIAAHAAIDAGASVILGTHPHVVQAMEVYNGGLILYSLGNFSFFRKAGSPNFCCPQGDYEFPDVYGIDIAPDIQLPYTRHRNEGCMVFIELDKQGLRKTGFVPTVMNEEKQAVIVPEGSEEFELRRSFVNWVSDRQPGGLSVQRVEDGRMILFERS
jgi:poly-gamma-glutamate synthesis protein (capsule biosynthesis protein)